MVEVDKTREELLKVLESVNELKAGVTQESNNGSDDSDNDETMDVDFKEE